MAEMVELVAKAICKSRFMDGGVEDDGWDSATDEMRINYLNEARAAIEVMREPTEAMRSVGADVAGNSEDGAAVIWHAMIDEALK